MYNNSCWGFSLEAEIHTYKTEVLKLERQLKEVNGQLSSTSKNLNMSQGMSAVNQDSLIALRAERDSLHTECASLRAQNTKLLTEQVSVTNSLIDLFDLLAVSVLTFLDRLFSICN